MSRLYHDDLRHLRVSDEVVELRKVMSDAYAADKAKYKAIEDPDRNIRRLIRRRKTLISSLSDAIQFTIFAAIDAFVDPADMEAQGHTLDHPLNPNDKEVVISLSVDLFDKFVAKIGITNFPDIYDR